MPRSLPAALTLFACACTCGLHTVEDCTTAGTCDGGSGGGVGGHGGGAGGGSGGGSGGDRGCTPCASGDVSWGYNGGLVAFTDTMSLAPCRAYARDRQSYVSPDGGAHCAANLAGCPDDTVTRLEALLADPVVTAALAAHVLYGADPRPSDGAVFRISAHGGYLEIGSCPSECRPAAVKALQDLLTGIDAAQIAVEPCKSAFP